MSEHWKSTPRYWCKHCACYVRDTKLERQNHEATARHQGNLKRFLRDLHRGHEREERDKERARQEIARVNGVVAGSSSSSASGPSGLKSTAAPEHDSRAAPTEAQLKRQREQLAEMGVAMPTEVRPEMAIPGEWQVTTTRVIEDKPEHVKVEAKATGVRKRDVTEEQKEEEDAVRGLFKKPRRWGRDSKLLPQEEDPELDALLSGNILTKPESDVKNEHGTADEDVVKEETAKTDEEEEKEKDGIKKEEDGDALSLPVKKEEGLDGPPGPDAATPDAAAGIKTEDGAPAIAPVVFKKRKAKATMRQK